MSAENTNRDSLPASLPSFYPVIVILLSMFIFFLGPLIGKSLAVLLLALLVGVILWQSFSVDQYEKMKQTYPGIKRDFWIINNLVYHLVIPGAVFAAVYICVWVFR